MIILNNQEMTSCQHCKKKDVVHKMYIFSNYLYCFICSMDILKKGNQGVLK